MERIDIPKLVEDIKAAEAAQRKCRWSEYKEKNGLHRWSYYEAHVTGLYTLRAWLRGRMHRKNPPAGIRDFNRTMEEQGRDARMQWDMEEHNRSLAEKTAERYLSQEQSTEPEGAPILPEPEGKGLLQRLFG